MSNETKGKGTEDDKVVGADQNLKNSIQAAAAAAANRAGVDVDTHRIGFTSAEGKLIVNVPIRDLDKLTLEEFNQGANVMFIYILLPEGVTLRGLHKSIPSGFYIVRASSLRKSRAQLLDTAGQLVDDIPIKVQEISLKETAVPIPLRGEAVIRPKPLPLPLLGFSSGFDGQCGFVDVTFRAFGRRWQIKVTFC